MQIGIALLINSEFSPRIISCFEIAKASFWCAIKYLYTYDASGNPLNWRNASAMNWTGRQLDSMTLTNGTALSFLYNSDGLRVSKTVGNNTVKYRWDGTTLLAEEHDDYTITFMYDGDTLIGFNYGGNNYYYGVDNLGVIHYVYNEAGTVVVTYTYDAWGNTISASGNSTLISVNPIRYKSYYYDSETGLFYLQSRYYDPIVGRFVNADDTNYLGVTGTVLSYNLYSYCENDPVNNDDLTGRGPFLAVGVQFVFTYKRFTIGIEFLWSTKNGKFYLFLFAGGINSRDINDVKSQKGNLLKKIANKVFQKSTNTKKKMLNILAKCGLSVSFVCVFGNKNVSFPSSYCGWFNNGSLSIRHFAVSGAFSRKENRFIGSFSFGATISTQKFSVGFSKTYYLQLTGDKAFENNMNNWDDYIYDQIKWLSVFALPIY